MREHGEVVLLEAANDLLEQNAVLEAPSGQGDGIEARPARVFAMRQFSRHCNDGVGETYMEAGGHQRRRSLQDEIADQRAPHRQRLDIRQAGVAQIGDGELVAAQGVDVDDRLQPRARLALMGMPLAGGRSAPQRPRRPAFRRRGLRGIDLAADHCVERRARPARKVGMELELGEIH